VFDITEVLTNRSLAAGNAVGTVECLVSPLSVPVSAHPSDLFFASGERIRGCRSRNRSRLVGRCARCARGAAG
jgi:hypothetical protein